MFEPEEIAVLLTMITDGINNMRPDLQMILASRGIDKEKFSRDARRLITAMITNSGMNNTRIGLTKEVLNMTMTHQNEDGTDYEKSRQEIEPVEVAVLLSVIFDGVSQIPPNLQMILKSQGIDEKKFSHDVRQWSVHHDHRAGSPLGKVSPPHRAGPAFHPLK